MLKIKTALSRYLKMSTKPMVKEVVAVAAEIGAKDKDNLDLSQKC